MFRHLQDYEEKSFWESNPYFYIYTPDGREITYHIYSAGQVEDTSDTYLTSFESDEACQSFLNMTKEVSLYDTGVELNAQSTIVGSKRKRGESEGAMKNGYIYEVGDIVTMKKPHPCGSKDWEILRVGADFRLKCTGCGHQIMIARRLVEKNTKDLKKKS